MPARETTFLMLAAFLPFFIDCLQIKPHSNGAAHATLSVQPLLTIQVVHVNIKREREKLNISSLKLLYL